MTKDEALKLALEAFEYQAALTGDDSTNEWNYSFKMQDIAVAAIKEALAQPEQEPVVGLQCVHCHITIESLNDKVMRLMKRPWVGLTDDERESIANATIRIHGQEWAYATAIEAKLKEKNA